ncbi:hypothetical protein H072_2091 [Dactylellina haptotyla CBS 200.50]|uniref:separase n=1 Tax=Dactylellina haptotyla (strain CBS 200.50) TaxID=1284197 RepID=S8C8B1_DACHA|nr:hypothetical protein H072_2091 [Dactylellina haptotyla CBS 200.50]
MCWARECVVQSSLLWRRLPLFDSRKPGHARCSSSTQPATSSPRRKLDDRPQTTYHDDDRRPTTTITAIYLSDTLILEPQIPDNHAIIAIDHLCFRQSLSIPILASTTRRPPPSTPLNMAVTKAATGPQDTIRKGLASLDSCTSTVPTLLRDLLFPGRQSASAPKHSRTKSVVVSKSKTAERPGSSAAHTDEQRSRIAVEALNSTLQLLKDASATSSSSNGKAAKSSSSKSTLDNVIDCGRHAISYLNSKDDCGLRPGTRESAHLNLINRLAQHGKYDIGLEEVINLKERLCNSKSDKKKPAEFVFDWAAFPEDQETLVLAIGVQISALRLIAAKPEVTILQKLPSMLERPNNIYDMVESLHKLSPPKALKQFESLITTIYASASAISNTREKEAAKVPMAHVATELRLIGISYRLRSSKLPEATLSTAQIAELWSMLSHSLSAVRSKPAGAASKENFQKLSTNVGSILMELSGDNASLGGFESKFQSCTIAIATLAEEAQCWDEAMNFLRNVEKQLASKQHHALINSTRIRIATSTLKALTARTSQANTMEDLQQALGIITQPLSGSKEKLQNLFLDIMQLRRAASGCLNSGKKTPEDIVRLLVEICFAVISFSRRCAIAGILELRLTSKDRAMIFASVDHFLVASRKCPRSNDADSWWEIEDQRLQEILALAQLLEDAIEDEETPAPEQKQNIFEKVSVFYQQHSITLRKENETEKSLQAFKRSISCVESRSLDEMMSSNLATKHERLGTMYMGLNDLSRAMECFEAALGVHVSIGDFDNITDHFAIGQIDDLHNDEERTIAKTLSQFVKCCLELGGKAKFWDKEDFDEKTRCLVILFQINASLTSGSPRGIKTALPYLSELLSNSEISIDIRSRAAMTLVSILSELPEKEMRAALQLAINIRDEVFELTKSATKDSPLSAGIFYQSGTLSLAITLAYLSDHDRKVDYLVDGLNCWEYLLDICSSREQLLDCSANGDFMVEKLRLLGDFLDMKGYSVARKQALELLVKLYTILDYSIDVVVKCKISLSIQYLRLGFSGKSGNVLSESDQWIKKEGVSTATKLEWNLAYIEYLLSTGEGNLNKGASYLSATQEIVENDPEVLAAAASGAKMQKRIELNRLVSRACYVSSLLALDKGNINGSIAFARRSLKLIQRAWAGLEALAKHKSQNSANSKNESAILTYTTTVAALSGPFLWPIVRSIYDILVHIATLYLHQGMQREALFYIQEARVVAEAVDSKSLLFHILSISGDLHIRLGMLEEGEEKLQQATVLKEHLLEKGKELVSFDCTLGIMYRKNKSWIRELDAYNNAEKTLETLMEGTGLKMEDQVFGDITERVANLQIAEVEKKPRGRAPKAAAKPKSTSKTLLKSNSKAPSVKAQQPPGAPSSTQCAGLVKLRGDVLRLKAVNLAIQQKWDLAQSLLKETADSSLGSRELVAQRLAVAKSSLLQAFAAIEEDDEFHTLQETAIVIPSVASVKTIEAAPAKAGKRTPKKGATVVKETNDKEVTPSRAAVLLHDARDNMLAVQALAASVCPTTTLNVLSTMLGEVICLLAAITSDAGMAKTIPAINSLELYRSISLLREKSAIEEEKIEAQELDDLRWPTLPPTQMEIDTASILNFQKNYIDIIPPSWAAVSISLGESREELFFTRYEAGQIPFMIRVPLMISEEMSMDEEQFGFEKGLASFRDIVNRANVSTHSAKDMITKDVRAKWWSEREVLDNELHDLLLNIENNWLRGYKGIFGGYKRHPELIARFNASFVKILNEHLPSRNSGNRKKNNKIVTLDERVVELFLGIGDPNEEDIDLDDSIQDLIYLVIDILQFHGERNAADEVDLDEMIVHITDALESYHKMVNEYEDSTVSDHTVLVLDKSLHMLPWESLPCLDGRSVSRLPSLATLRERLEMEAFSYTNSAGLYINRSNTGYILNPGLDLTNTQKTYEDELNSMSNWEGLVGKIPTEKDFTRYLDEKELFLYFGHGSGAQYIRARTVKKLNKCAVSLLMGCSSGKLTDAGEFEPYGMPLNYIQGGCPAVVVTLWDVTDKDIDKYSSRVFESWGLFKEEKEKKNAKGKGKIKIKHDGEAPVEKTAQGTASLCQAAATSRSACKMRYLNGAAPVVYGIPVYFK